MGQLNGLKPWTKEEMMAYLDWSNQEDDRVEARVADQIKKNRLLITLLQHFGNVYVPGVLQRFSGQQVAAYNERRSFEHVFDPLS